MSPRLPAQFTTFVGRKAELTQGARLLAQTRLLTLTGPGGCGKTRLAAQLVAEEAEHFPDGVWFIELGPLASGEFVLEQVAMTLGLKEPQRGITLVEVLGRWLEPRQTLIVLDNCEHVVAASAQIAAQLLAAAPRLKLVATSREPLAVAGEVTWAVPPLSDTEAVELFGDRARQARPMLELHEADVAAVKTICHRLDGLPLAIELAAARTRALPPTQIARLLNRRLSVLSRGPRTAPPRQATLQASFDWSYELLTDAERTLLRQLAVFAGGFDADAVLAICPAASIELLVALADRSLITLSERPVQGQARYRMLETIREFAADRLIESGESKLIRRRHRDYYLALAEQGEPMMFGPGNGPWLARLSLEQDNLRAALAWIRDEGETEALARLTVALFWFWAKRFQYRERRLWLEAAGINIADLPPELRGKVRNRQGTDAIWAASIREIPALFKEALPLARAAGDQQEEALALFGLAFAAGAVMGTEAMRPYIEEALPQARSPNLAWLAATYLSMLGLLRLYQSNPEEPRRLLDQAMALAKTADDAYALTTAVTVAGLTALTQGRLADADALLTQAVIAGRETDHSVALTLGLCGMAQVRMYRGDFSDAREAANEGLEWARNSGVSRVHIAFATWTLGWLHLVTGEAAKAKSTLEDAATLARSTELPIFASMPLVYLAEAEVVMGELDEARATLEDASSLARERFWTGVLGRAGMVGARLRVREGNLSGAEASVDTAIALQREAGDQLRQVDALELLAHLAAAHGSPKEAVRLWAAADSRRTVIGYALFPRDHDAHEAAIAAAKQVLGQDGYAAAWIEGARLSLDEAIAYAARGRGDRKRPSTGWASLTPSEVEVVRLVGQHLSNPDIAARLFVSRSTVRSHLLHIFSKLGIDSRSQLAAEAINRGLVRRSELP